MNTSSLSKKSFSLPFFVEQDEDGVWVAECPIFDGCFTQGYSIQELQENIQDVSQLYFGLLKDGYKVLKGKHLISAWFDHHGSITNPLSQTITQDITQKMISTH